MTRNTPQTSPAAGSSDPPVLDLTLLQEAIPDDEGRLCGVLARFVEVARQTLAELERVTVDVNMGEIADLAHRLKSSSLTAGAFALAESCQCMEDAGCSGDIRAITALKANVNAEFRRAAEAIERRIASGTPGN